MPRYNLRIGNQRIPVANTDTPLSQALGKRLASSSPETNVDSAGSGHRYEFGGQELDYEDLRDIKDIRDSGGQVAQLMQYKALLNFGEGAEIHVENNDETEEIVDGDAVTLQEWLEHHFPNLDLLVLDLGEDALWYPYAVGEIQETRGGDFKRALPAEPWTLIPETDEQGEIEAWMQRTKTRGGGYTDQRLPPQDLWHIVINKASARDKTGISEVLRNHDEIQAFKENEQAINQAIELHGFPQRHVKVGREDGAPVSDDDLRRVRTIFDPHTTDANTAYFTGQDVNVETLEAHQFDYSAIHEMDMRNLTTALGLPLEAGNVGSDGLGSGKPAELRFALLKLAIKANQRSFATQFVEKVMRPVIRDYSPFDHTASVTMDIGDPLEDIGEVADLLGKIGDYMTNDEARRKLDLPEPEDDEVGEAYRSPADVERAEEEDGGGPLDGAGGGFFSDTRSLDTPEGVPSNAVSISDRSEAPEDASIVTGPGGGLYYVPGGGGDAAGGGGGEMSIEDVEVGDEVVVDATIQGPDGDPVDISNDEISVVDVDPSYGLLIEHPEHGRGEVPVDDIDGITDPDEDTDGNGDEGGASDSVAGLDLDDTDPDSDTILSEDQKEQVADRITSAHGEAGEEALGLANNWRQNSISGAAETLARGLKEVGGLDGDVRDSGRDASDPSGEELDAISDMREMSQEYFDEKFDGEAELVRGARRNGRDEFLASFFTGSDDVEINANAVDNYTSEENLATEYAGEDGLVLRPTVSSEDVQLANASLFAEGFEDAGDEYLIDSPDEISVSDAELRIGGESVRVSRDPNEMDAEEVRLVADAIEDPSPEVQAGIDEWLASYEGEL